MVVARPGGCQLASSVCRSSARWPFTCLEAVPPFVVTGQLEHVSRDRSDLVAPDACFAPILPGNENCRGSRHAIHSAADRWSLGAGCVRRRDAVEECVRSAHRMAARCHRAIQNRRTRARAPLGRSAALALGCAQGPRCCRSSRKGCRLRKIMSTRSTSFSFHTSLR